MSAIARYSDPSLLRDPEWLKAKLRNCLAWISGLGQRWHSTTGDLPAAVQAAVVAAQMAQSKEEILSFYTSELFFANLMKNEFAMNLAQKLHLYYKLDGSQRQEALDQGINDAKTWLNKMHAMIDDVEKNKDKLSEDLFKAGAYTEIFLWPYLYKAVVEPEA